MAAIGQTALTLADWAKRVDDGGKVSKVTEILSDTNEIIEDMLWVEGNLPTGHKTTIRSGLPTVAWRMLNYGVQPSKSRVVQVTDACGMLEAYSEVDKSLADLNGNTSEFRMSEDKAFLEAMNQEFASTLFYGNTSVNPEKFLGLSTRFNSTTAENGGNVIKGSSNDTDNTSIWLVVWGDQTVHGIFPKGSPTGLSHRDLGEETLWDSQTPAGKYQGYRSHYKWDCGLTVRDWRYVVRIPNIEVSDLTKTGSTGDDLLDLMTQALEQVPSLNIGKPVFYCNRTIRSFLRRQMANRSNILLSLQEAMGKHVIAFDGVPVKRCDSILNTEAAVS